MRWLRRVFDWIWRTDVGGEDRAALVRVLIAIVWLPVQVTLSLLFATGGIFLLLMLGIVVAPFVGAISLIRHLLRARGSDHEAPAGPVILDSDDSDFERRGTL